MVKHLLIAALFLWGAAARADANQAQRVLQRIIKQTNQFRSSHKLEPLELDEKLMRTAQYFAEYMARTGRYGHEADGRDVMERVKAHGYEYCLISENIAFWYNPQGFSDDALTHQFVHGWETSPGHRANMLEPYNTQLGVGLAQSANGKWYGVQVFGRPRSLAFDLTVENKSRQTVRYLVDDHEYTLAPRVSRQHLMCKPGRLILPITRQQAAADKPETKVDPSQIHSVKEEVRFLVRDGEKGLSIKIIKPPPDSDS